MAVYPWKRSDSIGAIVLLAASVASSYLRWCKLYSLVSGDPSCWLNQAYRWASGEFPYRDFFLPYPPLGVAMIAFPFRWLGARFWVAQLAVDFISAAIIALAYLIARRLMPRPVALATAFLVVAVCSTTQTYFCLFSLSSYSPSLLSAALGLLAMLLGSLRYVQSGAYSAGTGILIVAGAWIALLSKQESFLLAPVLLTILARHDRGILRHAILALACFLVPLAVYAGVAQYTGVSRLCDALAGYGLASLSCPWWPTGLGLFGAIAALGTAAFILVTISIAPGASSLRANLSRPGYILLCLGGFVGLAVYIGYGAYSDNRLLSGSEPWLQKFRQLIPDYLASNAVLRPVLWTVLLYWIYLVWTSLRNRRAEESGKDGTIRLLILATPALLSARTLFGNLLSPEPSVAALAYPFLLILGPYLLLRGLNFERGHTQPACLTGLPGSRRAVIAMALAYAFIRLAGGYPVLMSDRGYGVLESSAGRVLLRDYQESAAAYQFAAAHSREGDSLLELPYGAGISFALHRRSASYSVMFQEVPQAASYQALDVDRVRESLPAVVVADDAPNYGTFYGCQEVTCAFPNFVWMPSVPDWRGRPPLAIVNFVVDHFRVAGQEGRKLFLLPAGH